MDSARSTKTPDELKKAFADLSATFAEAQDALSNLAAITTTIRKKATRSLGARAGWQSDPSARNRRIAAMHRPKADKLDSINVYADGRRVVLRALVMQPTAQHATRRFNALLSDIGQRIATGEITPGEVSFVCSEFVRWTRDGHNFFVLNPGDAPIPAKSWKADHAAQTITFESELDDSGSPTISPPHFLMIAWYLAV